MNELTQRGISAARSGNKERARQLLGSAVESDDDNIAAWWWLARVIDDPKARHKCLEKAQAAAAQSEEGSRIYKQLLQESGAPILPRLKLAGQSKSTGDQCPVCTAKMSVGEEVVVCPTCHRANHWECWEDNVFHCGNFACDGSGLIDRNLKVQIEASAKAETVRVEPSDIPKESPWASREKQEAGFMNRLKQQARRTMLADVIRETFREAAREVAQEQAMRQELKRRTQKAFFAGLVSGAFLAVPVFRESRSWMMALLTVVLCSRGAAGGAMFSMLPKGNVTNVLYGLLPAAAATFMMWAVFKTWNNGLAAAAAGLIGWLVIVPLSRKRPLIERRAWLAFSGWGLVAWLTIQLIIHK